MSPTPTCPDALPPATSRPPTPAYPDPVPPQAPAPQAPPQPQPRPASLTPRPASERRPAASPAEQGGSASGVVRLPEAFAQAEREHVAGNGAASGTEALRQLSSDRIRQRSGMSSGRLQRPEPTPVRPERERARRLGIGRMPLLILLLSTVLLLVALAVRFLF